MNGVLEKNLQLFFLLLFTEGPTCLTPARSWVVCSR